MPVHLQGTSLVDEIEIEAPPDVVWRALTEPKELVRWLPLRARVQPGQGGSFYLSWGEPVVEESSIVAWSPGKHLRLLEQRPFGGPFQPAALKGAKREIDFKLSSKSPTTLLQFEHTNIGAPGVNAAISNFAQSMAACWEFQLNSLDIYASQHFGQNRTVSWARSLSPLSFGDTWNRVMGPQGLQAGLAQARAEQKGGERVDIHERTAKGQRYEMRAANGDTFNGTVLTHMPGKQFAGIVDNMDGAVLRVVLDHCAGRPETTVWLARYNYEDYEEAMLFEHRWINALQTMLYAGHEDAGR